MSIPSSPPCTDRPSGSTKSNCTKVTCISGLSKSTVIVLVSPPLMVKSSTESLVLFCALIDSGNKAKAMNHNFISLIVFMYFYSI